MIPGRALHRLAASICSAQTLERIVEPAIADLQKEYAAKRSRGTVERGWTLLRGYSAILKVTAICALSISITRDEERTALARTFWWSSGMVIAVGALLTFPPLYSYRYVNLGWFGAVTLVPQVVPLAIPIGIAFGVAFGLSARPAANIAKVMLLSAIIASAVSVVILTWVIPAANQAFREATIRELRARGYDGVVRPPKGPNETTFPEIRDEIARLTADGGPRMARLLRFNLYLRFALPWATLALVSVLLAAPVTRRSRRGALAFAACFVYWVLMFVGEAGNRRGYLTAPIGAWLPNVVLITFAIVIASSRSSRLRGSVVSPQ